MTRLRLLFVISTLAVLATALVACGGGGGGGGENPQTVLDQTFSSANQPVKSGVLDLKVNASGQGKSFDLGLSGPFESLGKNKIPSLDFTAKLSTSGTQKDVNFEGGLITTPNAAFVSYKGTDYSVPSSVYSQIQAAVENSSAQQSQNQQSASALLKQLGINNPKDLLTNLKNDGTADVEGTGTNHISGDVDVGKAIDAVKSALSSASALGALGGASSQLPNSSQLDQVKSAVKAAHFDLYSGQDDHILRRLTINVSIAPPSGGGTVNLTFDITLSKVNESQTITAPSGAKPLSGLLQQLGVNPASLGALGAISGGVPGSGIVGKGTPTTPPSGAPSAQAQKYLNCISKAKSAADLQNCQSLAP